MEVCKIPAVLWFVGHPINIFWDYKYDRIWQDTPEDNKMMQLYQK